jgi:hypothetical protein
LVIEAGIITSVKDLHPSNTAVPKVVTPFGKAIV